MFFIAKNPISAPEANSPPSPPVDGTRGLFPMSDGWYDIDKDGTVKKIGDGGTGGGENVQSDWNQSDESAPDYIKNKPDKDKWVLHEEYKEYVTYIYINHNDGTWECNTGDIGFSNLRVGEKYRFITELSTVEVIIPDDKVGIYKFYSEDGKANLEFAGFYGYFDEETGEVVSDNSIFTGTFNLGYSSSVGETIQGRPIEEIPWDEWGYYGYDGTMYSEYYEPQIIDYRYLPDDIEKSSNKVSDVNWEYLTPDDETYPTSLATYALVLQMRENIRETDIYPLYPIINGKASQSDLEGFANDLSQRISGVEEEVQGKASTSYVDGFVQQLQDEVNSMNEPIGYLLEKVPEIEGKTTFELIEKDTLATDVNVIVPDLKGIKYKEIYCYLKVPPMADAADNTTAKGRFYITDSGDKYTKVLWNNENFLVDNWTLNWNAVVHIKVFGNLCSTTVWYDKWGTTPYPKTPNASNKTGGEAPFENLGTLNDKVTPKTYLENPGIIFAAKSGETRVLPVGTEYEFWGVKA